MRTLERARVVDVIELVPLGDEDRAALHEAIRESIEQMERGELIDGEQALVSCWAVFDGHRRSIELPVPQCR